MAILLLSIVSATYRRSSPQFTSTQPSSGLFGFGRSSLEFDESMCSESNDFLIQLAPFGCTPAVVRSDLLEEQNVPVFCQLAATKINPLIDVEAIESMSFTGKYSEHVAGVGFHPAKAALGTETRLNSPILDNIGYVVVVLRKQEDPSKMPEYVSGNLTAKIKYDIKNAFGIGKASFSLPVISDAEWDERKLQYGFWRGKGYLRAESVLADSASISLYDDTNRLQTVRINKGETSNKIRLPGFDCLATLQLKLDDVKAPDTRFRLRIDNEIVEVTRGESFLDNKCKVTSYDKKGIQESMTVSCKQDAEASVFDFGFGGDKLEFRISPNVSLTINGVTKEYSLGDKLYGEEGKEQTYLGYIGQTEKGEYFIIPVTSPKQTSKEFMQTLLFRNMDTLVRTAIEEKTGNVVADSLQAMFARAAVGANRIIKGDKILGLIGLGATSDEGITFDGFAGPMDKILKDDVKLNYEHAMQDYNDVINSFPTEKQDITVDTTIGEEAFRAKIKLAKDLKQIRTMVNLCEDFENKYPKKQIPFDCIGDYKLSNSEDASQNVFINGAAKRITFEGIYEPDFKDYGTLIRVTGRNPDTGEIFDEQLRLTKGTRYLLLENDNVELVSLDDEAATFRFNVEQSISQKGTSVFRVTGRNIRVKKGESEINIGKNSYGVTVQDIHLDKVAKVSVLPGIDNAGSVANFSFNVGIEKRSIELSPEKTKKLIKNLNSTIKEWEDRSESIGRMVKGLKGACLGVGAGLMIKNFFSNLGGKGIARQNVMNSPGGWKEKCQKLIAAKEHTSLDQCYGANAAKIEADVNKYHTDYLNPQNQQIKAMQEQYTKSSGGILGGSYVDEEKRNADYVDEQYKKELRDRLMERYPNGKIEVQGKTIVVDEFVESINPKTANFEDLRTLQLNSRVGGGEGQLDEISKRTLESTVLKIHTETADLNKLNNLQKEASELGLGGASVIPTKDTKTLYYDGSKTKQSPGIGSLPGNTAMTVRLYQGKKYHLEMVEQSKGTYTIGRIWDANGNSVPVPDRITEGETEETKDLRKLRRDFTFAQADAAYYNNPYAGKPELRYFETEPYKGHPAVVPVDVKKGWYASIQQTIPIGGAIRAFDASGRVNSFYLCNIGPNKLEENRGGDDVCQMINTGTGQPYNKFAGLSEQEAARLVNRAVEAIREASSRYKNGISGAVRILGQTVYVGAPAANVPSMQCQDMMSPQDCKLLFNVCDPVICPSSRCNLGGAFEVKDVIQSGIFGSIVLCLPNFPEVFVPVCLSGIKAGIDGWLSILKSYRDCLQESLDSGKMTGICDEIYSLHACEFFWRQSIPILKLGLPKLLSSFAGEGARGGGEYMGVQQAWDNAQASTTYFSQYYAANSFKAFQARSTEEVGTDVCKTFISGVFPTGDFFDTFTDPDSPPQFHGRLDEIPYTTATNPPTSQYKVFYHIFAGEDSGSYYKVYLRGGSTSSYYQDTSASRLVEQGYVKKGEYASETKDFTAPSGYKELCINVNGQEECGFKQVSTSFAVDYINDKHVQSIAKEQVTSESQCISGSVSAYSLLSPNLEGGVDEMINPAVYNRGIIRVCATRNPGIGTDAKANAQGGRWKDVGFCGDKNIRCWLDQDSVKDVVKNTDIEKDILSTAEQRTEQILKSEGNYITDKQWKELLGKLNKLEPKETIDEINKEYPRAFWSAQKAVLLLKRGDAYSLLAGGGFGFQEYKRQSIFRKVSNFLGTSSSSNPFDTMAPNIDFVYSSSLEISEEQDIGSGLKQFELSDGTSVESKFKVNIDGEEVYIEELVPEVGFTYHLVLPKENLIILYATSTAVTSDTTGTPGDTTTDDASSSDGTTDSQPPESAEVTVQRAILTTLIKDYTKCSQCGVFYGIKESYPACSELECAMIGEKLGRPCFFEDLKNWETYLYNPIPIVKDRQGKCVDLGGEVFVEIELIELADDTIILFNKTHVIETSPRRETVSIVLKTPTEWEALKEEYEGAERIIGARTVEQDYLDNLLATKTKITPPKVIDPCDKYKLSTPIRISNDYIVTDEELDESWKIFLGQEFYSDSFEHQSRQKFREVSWASITNVGDKTLSGGYQVYLDKEEFYVRFYQEIDAKVYSYSGWVKMSEFMCQDKETRDNFRASHVAIGESPLYTFDSTRQSEAISETPEVELQEQFGIPSPPTPAPTTPVLSPGDSSIIELVLIEDDNDRVFIKWNHAKVDATHPEGRPEILVYPNEEIKSGVASYQKWTSNPIPKNSFVSAGMQGADVDYLNRILNAKTKTDLVSTLSDMLLYVPSYIVGDTSVGELAKYDKDTISSVSLKNLLIQARLKNTGKSFSLPNPEKTEIEVEVLDEEDYDYAYSVCYRYDTISQKWRMDKNCDAIWPGDWKTDLPLNSLEVADFEAGYTFMDVFLSDSDLYFVDTNKERLPPDFKIISSDNMLKIYRNGKYTNLYFEKYNLGVNIYNHETFVWDWLNPDRLVGGFRYENKALGTFGKFNLEDGIKETDIYKDDTETFTKLSTATLKEDKNGELSFQ